MHAVWQTVAIEGASRIAGTHSLIDEARAAAAAIISHAWHWGGPAPAHASGGVC
jgi:hypothetical protein